MDGKVKDARIYTRKSFIYLYLHKTSRSALNILREMSSTDIFQTVVKIRTVFILLFQEYSKRERAKLVDPLSYSALYLMAGKFSLD